MTCKSVFFLIVTGLAAFLFSCSGRHEEDQQRASAKADSLSRILNAPELKAVNALLLKEPDNAELYHKRAVIYFNLKQLDEAVNDSKRAIRLDSTKAPYFLTLADVYFTQNNTRLAKELLEMTEKKFPENTEALLKLAELFFLVRQYQKGIDYVNRVLKIDPNIAKAYYIKGSIYRESGDTARAISSLETAVEQDNRYTDAFYDLGIIYAARKSPVAFEYYDNVSRIDPANDDVRYARAKLLQDLNKTNEAISEYEALVKKNPNCVNCYYNLGAIYLEIRKDNKQALENFTSAIEKDSAYAEAYFARGYTYAKMKDKESARKDYKKCLELRPDFDAAIQALNEL
jgi:tetratricopeptide (TPR) repeat protein